MECLYCGQQLRGFGDAEVVKIHDHKYIACRDLEACAARRDQNEAVRQGMEPAAAAGRE